MFRVQYIPKNEMMGASVLSQLLPFVAKDDETRPSFKYINVAGLWVQATDGKRAARVLKHRLAVNPAVPDGLYTAVKEGKDFILIPQENVSNFPNLDSVYPKEWRIQFKAATDAPKAKSKEESLADLAFRLAKADVRMNPRFLRDLPSDRWIVGVNSSTRPVILRGEVFEVVLMPLMPPSEKGEIFNFGNFVRVPYEEEVQPEQTAVESKTT
jgi:hypothetical protein